MARRIGVLTAGGDSPGLNAVLRGSGKAVQQYKYGLVGLLSSNSLLVKRFSDLLYLYPKRVRP